MAQPTPVRSVHPNDAATQLTSDHHLATQLSQEAQDKRALRHAVVVAVAAHLGLLAISFPTLGDQEATDPERPKAYVVKHVHFKPKPPEPTPPISEPRKRLEPMPDATPHEPEVLSDFEPEVFDDIPIDDLDIALPLEAPPPPQDTPQYVTGDITKPVRIYDPPPTYTELARKVRVEGRVILQSTIDASGNVVDVSVIKGLGMGLSESAVSAVKRWKFEPATLNGKPIAVYYNLTVTFDLN